jgi:hypothetical protein
MRNPTNFALRFVAVLTIAGCGATATTATPPPPPTTVRVVGGVGGQGATTAVTTSASDLPTAVTYSFAVDRVWRTLPEVFDSLGIPVAHLDHNSRVIGNKDLKIRGRLGRVPLRRYLDCGSTQGGPNADTYDVWMSVLGWAQPKDARTTELALQLEAMARPVTFAGDYFKCSTTRELEKALNAILARRLAAGGS